MTLNRRKIPFSRHPLERQYLKFVLLAMLCPVLLVAGCLYYLIWQTVAYELAIPELIAQSLFPAFEQVNQILLIGTPLLFALFLFFARRMAHRFAGPLNRIERELNEMTEKHDFSVPIKIREKDALYPLVQKINKALQVASSKEAKK